MRNSDSGSRVKAGFPISAELCLSLIMANTEESFIFLDRNFSIKIFNDKAKCFYKRHIGVELTEGDQFIDYVALHGKEIIKDRCLKVLAGQTLEWDSKVTFLDGTIKELISKFKPVSDSSGKVIGIFATSLDVTEERKSGRLLSFNEKRFKALIEHGEDVISLMSPEEFKLSYISSAVERVLGYSVEEISSLGLVGVIHSEDMQYLDSKIKECMLENEKNVSVRSFRMRHKEGKWRWMEGTVANFLNDEAIGGIVFNYRDTTERNYFYELDNLEKYVIKLSVSDGKHLKEIVKSYLTGIESLHPGMLCSVQQKNGEQLFNLASPSLPEAYTSQIDGLEVGDNVGSCGTAAFLKQKIVAEDIEIDPRWQNYKHIATNFGLRTCWSIPIMNELREVIATFACYYKESHLPSELEENTIYRATRILQIVLENYQKTRALMISNERFEYVVQATSDIIWDWDLKKDKIIYSVNMEKILGYPSGSNAGDPLFLAKLVHPADRQSATLTKEDVIKGNFENWVQEYRIMKASGDFAYVLDKGIVIRDKRGIPIRMVGAMRDVTERLSYIKAIEDQNRKLMEIGWMQSHIIRAPVSRILGLTSLIQMQDMPTEERNELINYIQMSVKELDHVIHEITAKTDAVNIPQVNNQL